MQERVFEHSFLQDSLNLEQVVRRGVFALANGNKLDVKGRGVVEYVPSTLSETSKYIIISTGIHGNETAPIEMVANMVDEIIKGRLSPKHRCLFIIAHPQATNAETRFIDENLNRLFEQGPTSATIEGKIATTLKQHVSDFFANSAPNQRWHLDLHCAIRRSEHYTFAVSPHTSHATRSKALFDFLQESAIEAALLSHSPSSTFSWFSAEYFAAQAVTLELGQVAKLGSNDFRRLEPFRRGLQALLCDKPIVSGGTDCPTLHIYRVTRTISRTEQEFSFTFSEDLANFSRFSVGDLLGFDGETLLYCQHEGEAVVFPNAKVALNHRAALMAIETDICFENGQLQIN